jgi:hypothetical protein
MATNRIGIIETLLGALVLYALFQVFLAGDPEDPGSESKYPAGAHPTR